MDATWAAPLAAGNVDKDFRVTISFDETNHTYTSEDHQSQSKSGVSFNPLAGQVSFGKSSESFSGHMIGKEMGFGLGRAQNKLLRVSSLHRTLTVQLTKRANQIK